MSSYKGASLNPGSVPNIAGDYGNGYVIAYSNADYYQIAISNSLSKANNRVPNNERQKQEILDKFRELLKNH